MTEKRAKQGSKAGPQPDKGTDRPRDGARRPYKAEELLVALLTGISRQLRSSEDE